MGIWDAFPIKIQQLFAHENFFKIRDILMMQKQNKVTTANQMLFQKYCITPLHHVWQIVTTISDFYLKLIKSVWRLDLAGELKALPQTTLTISVVTYQWDGQQVRGLAKDLAECPQSRHSASQQKCIAQRDTKVTHLCHLVTLHYHVPQENLSHNAVTVIPSNWYWCFTNV